MADDNPGYVKDQFTRAYYDLQSELGTFLRSGKDLYAIKDAAKEYQKLQNDQVKALASAIVARANAALTTFASIESQAQAKLSEGSTVMDKMNTDKTWKNILAANWSSFGWDTLKVAREILGRITTLGKDFAAITVRMNAHMKEVSGLKSDLGDLGSLAEGKGFSGVASSIMAGLQTPVNRIVTIGAIAIAALLVGPPLVQALIPAVAGGVRKARKG